MVADNVNDPAVVVIPKSLTTAVPPLSFTIVFTIVNCGALSLFVIEHVTLAPSASVTVAVCGLPLLPTVPPVVQLQVPSV